MTTEFLLVTFSDGRELRTPVSSSTGIDDFIHWYIRATADEVIGIGARYVQKRHIAQVAVLSPTDGNG